MTERAMAVIKILEERLGWDCSTLDTTKICPMCSRGFTRYDNFCSNDGTPLVNSGTLDSVDQVETALREVIGVV